ncbi:sulfatase [Prosthecobacter sp.]|uniref:sulfatase n=1 Tax=Prosthecobacter sp. TaxID=1965333 RepID=UPI003783FA5E
MKLIAIFSTFTLLFCGAGPFAADRPNILFIAIDDMRDWTGYSGSAQAKTPNMDRLAKSGVAFTRAYTAYALCNPSRTALLTGLRPSTTGVITNGEDWRVAVPAERPSLPGYLHAQGYRTLGQGKIFHGSKVRQEEWDEYAKDGEREEKDADKKDWSLKPGKTPDGFMIGSNDIAPLDSPEEELVDYKTASFGVAQLGKAHDRPFFLACGFHRPHLPWNAPHKYFEMFPLESISLPELKTDDLADLPKEGVIMAKAGEFAAIRDLNKYRECVRAYLACIAFTDAQVGRLLDALEKSPHKDSTIVCLWSDHGWHHGEKEHWRKSTLWEEATRAPLIWRVPGMTKPGSVCERPVDFLGIYPTLCDLAGLPLPPHLQGVSLKPLLADPQAAWEHPAISTMHDGNHAIRTERWRYIHYANGGEELYDEQADPHEWTNLAGMPEHAAMKAELAKWLPADAAPVTAKAKKKKKKP